MTFTPYEFSCKSRDAQLMSEIKAMKQNEEYAWKNTLILEKAYQAELAKRDLLARSLEDLLDQKPGAQDAARNLLNQLRNGK